MTQGVVYQDADGNITAANPAAERILGRNLNAAIGETPPQSWAAVNEKGKAIPGDQHPAAQAMQTGQAVSEMLMGVFNPVFNERRWLLVSATPLIRPGEKSPYETCTTFTDVTELRRKEASLLDARHQLEEKDSFLQNILDNIPQHLFWKGRDGFFLGCNRAGAKVAGLSSPDDIVGRSDYDLYRNRMDGDYFFRLDQEVMARDQAELHVLTQRQLPDGTPARLDITKVPLHDNRGEVNGLLISYQDLTHHTEVEAGLRTFKEAVEQSVNSILITDIRGMIEYVNPHFCRTYGYQAGEVLGKNASVLKSPHTPDEEYRKLWKSLNTGKSWHGEFLNLTKNGSAIWQSVTVSPLFDQDGKIVHFLSIQEDLSERKALEADLQEQLHFTQTILDAIPSPIFYKDMNGCYLGCNAAYEAFFGTRKELLIGKTVFDIAPFELANKYHAMDMALFEKQGTQTYESSVTLADGSERAVIFHKATFSGKDGNLSGLIGSILDITERKQIEARTQHAHDHYLNILDHAPVLIWRTGTDAKRNWFNATWLAFTGRDLEQEIGDGWTEGVHLEDVERCVSIHGDCFQIRQPFAMEYRIRRHDGEYRWIADLGVPLNSSEHEFIGCIGYCFDISERKQAEQELTELNANLSRLVSREVSNGIQKERMLIQQARHAAMGEMIGNIAHQWRQPLSMLGLVIQNIEMDFEEGELDSKAMEQYVTKAMSAIQKMSTTIDDFRNFFQPNLHKTSFGIMMAVRDALNLVEASLNTHEIEIVLKSAGDVEIWGHQNEFTQVLLNLLGNAKDALLERNVRPGKIEIEVMGKESGACIVVRDNAGGIPMEIAERVFDPYFTTKEKGTGIGLYMTKTIVERHMGGSIQFHNADEGAEFLIVLPRENMEESAQEP
jgi:PAS domain S-box-containing protein